MPRTPPFFADKLQELKSLAQALSSGLQSQLQEVINDPRKVAALIEEKSPRLSRELLSVASNMTDPFVVGMGLQISKLEEDHVEVTLPQRWRNQAEGGEFHIGALCTLAEFASKIYWSRHLSGASSEKKVSRMEINMIQSSKSTADGALKAKYSLSSSEREGLLLKLRTQQVATIDSLVKIFDAQEKLVAEVTIDWQFAAQLALSASPKQTEQSQ